MLRSLFVLVVVALSYRICSCFSFTSTTKLYTVQSSNYCSRRYAVIGSDDEENLKKGIPLEETSVDYTGSVDWDAEWKKVVKNKEISTKDRPGKDFYRSEAEIAAIRAANKATEQAVKLVSKVPSVPSWDTVKGDWRFWIAVLAVISIGSSVLSGLATQSTTLPTNASPGSYYI